MDSKEYLIEKINDRLRIIRQHEEEINAHNDRFDQQLLKLLEEIELSLGGVPAVCITRHSEAGGQKPPATKTSIMLFGKTIDLTVVTIGGKRAIELSGSLLNSLIFELTSNNQWLHRAKSPSVTQLNLELIYTQLTNIAEPPLPNKKPRQQLW